MSKRLEVYLSVDVETAGPIPGEYSMLTIGACDAYKSDLSFSVKLKPTTLNADPKALEVAGLSLEDLARDGLEPTEGMRAFGEWVATVTGPQGVPVFVGFNAPFDWSFVNYYFIKYLGNNPFGFAALDIKSLYMGAVHSSWSDTRSSVIAAALKPSRKGDHNALHDALYQAEIFRLIMDMR
jgi:DNA polymerase III epsilon subunit-like protein